MCVPTHTCVLVLFCLTDFHFCGFVEVFFLEGFSGLFACFIVCSWVVCLLKSDKGKEKLIG